MYCKYCGKKISDDSMFCEHCGSKLDNIAKENILKRDMCSQGDRPYVSTDGLASCEPITS